MNHSQGDAIDALVRQHFDGPVPDDGFCDQLMQKLPRHRRRMAWPLWIAILVGVGACWLTLATAPVLRAGWHDWMRGELSASAITLLLAMAATSLLAMWWSMSEIDGR